MERVRISRVRVVICVMRYRVVCLEMEAVFTSCFGSNTVNLDSHFLMASFSLLVNPGIAYTSDTACYNRMYML